MLAEIASIGTASVKRIYGDWTRPQLNTWKTAASEHVIQPMQQFANTVGKNATDSALIMDAMDLLYTGRFQGFCIVSPDSDFTRLAARIREEGITVYGFGGRRPRRSEARATGSRISRCSISRQPSLLPKYPSRCPEPSCELTAG